MIKIKMNKGFSAVELVLVIALLGILSVAVGPPLASAVKGYQLVSDKKTMLGQVQSGLFRMGKEISLIPGAAQITSIGANSFSFQYPTGTPISYTLSSGILMRNADPLIDDVTSLTFTYYDGLGNITATLANIRLIQITLSIKPLGSTSTYTARTQIFIRNMGGNYVGYAMP